MKLTEILFRWKKRLPRGHLFRGKYRLVKPVTPEILARTRDEFQLEEQNMFYLRHPYLTLEQTKFASVIPDEKEIKEKEEKKKLEWNDHKFLGDRFGFLKTSDSWE